MYIKYSYGKILCPNHVNLFYFFHMWNMASLSSYCRNILLKMNIRKITRGFGMCLSVCRNFYRIDRLYGKYV